MQRLLIVAYCFLLAFQSLPAQQPPPPTGETLQRLEFPNSDVREVLTFYSRLSGKRLVYDNTVQGPVNIVVSTPVSKDEALRIIEINLLLNGFTLVPADGDIVKVIGLSKNPRTAGVPIYSESDQIPDGDAVISFLFKLRSADATEVQQMLSQYVAPSLYTSIVALPKSQAILVTESTPVIRGLLKIIHEVDVRSAEVVDEFVKLERADAKDVVEKLEKIFEKTVTPGAPPAAVAARPVPIPEGAPPVPTEMGTPSSGSLTEDSIIVGKIKLTADVRTNRIHVVTRPVNMPFVRKLIREFDSDVPFGVPTKRPLKYVSAGEVLDVVVKAITEPGVKAEDSGGGTSGTTGSTQQRNSNQSFSSRGSSFGGYGGYDSGGTGFSEELSTESRDTVPTAVTVGNTKIIADRRANTIIVLGNEEVKGKIFKLLDEIDVRAPQVMLNTVIGELTLTNDQKFGVDYLLHAADNKNDWSKRGVAGILRNTTAPILDPKTAFKASDFAATGGLTGFISATDSLEIIVQLLESTGRFRVTNRPMIFASNNKKAVIASGQEIAVPTQTLSSLTNTTVDTVTGVPSVSSNVNFKRVALQLEVVPLINSDREVSLEIVQKLDSVVPGADRNVGGSEVPTISTRQLKTSVSVANRSTLVLGGLITRSDGKNSSGIPLLSKIPGVGALFRSNKLEKSRSELIVLIRPVVTLNPVEDADAVQREQERLMIEPNLEATLDATTPDKALKQVAPAATPNFRYEK